MAIRALILIEGTRSNGPLYRRPNVLAFIRLLCRPIQLATTIMPR